MSRVFTSCPDRSERSFCGGRCLRRPEQYFFVRTSRENGVCMVLLSGEYGPTFYIQSGHVY